MRLDRYSWMGIGLAVLWVLCLVALGPIAFSPAVIGLFLLAGIVLWLFQRRAA